MAGIAALPLEILEMILLGTGQPWQALLMHVCRLWKHALARKGSKELRARWFTSRKPLLAWALKWDCLGLKDPALKDVPHHVRWLVHDVVVRRTELGYGVGLHGDVACARLAIAHRCSPKAVFVGAAGNANYPLLRWANPRVAKGCTEAAKRAAASGHVGVLTWLEEHSHVTKGLVRVAVRHGQLDVLKWCKDHGQSVEHASMSCAMRRGLAMVKWLESNGCKIPRWLVNIAAEVGDLNAITWCLDRGCQATHQTTFVAAQYGHADVLEWLLNQGVNVRSEAYGAAGGRNNIACMDVLFSHGVPLVTMCVDWCIAEDEPASFEWMQRHGIVFGIQDVNTAIECGAVACLEFLVSHGVHPDQDCLSFAILCDTLECATCLADHGVEANDAIRTMARQCGPKWARWH